MFLKKPFAAFSLLAAFSCAIAEIHHFPKTYDLVDVNWRISIDEPTRTITGDVINTIRPLEGNTTSVTFDAGRLDISRVTVDGKSAEFTTGNELLVVNLPSPAAKGQTLKIETFYSAQPQAGVYFIPAKRAFPAHTSVVYTQGEMIDTRYWIPTYDWPDNKATFESYIEVPKGYYALSNGKLIGVQHNGDKDVYHWKLDQPSSTYLLSFVAGKYFEGQDAGADIPTYYYVPEGLGEMGEAAFGGTSKIVDFYGKILDFKYPYAKFSQAAVPDYMFGGMENVTCVTQTITALYPHRTEPVTDSTGLVAHELAHQWFGDTLTCVDWKNAWLNEGFASFMPVFWTREKSGEEAFDLERLDVFNGGYFSQAGGQRAVVWDQVEEPIDLFDGVLYPGGASRLFMLMYKLGEKPFWKGMHDYLEQYQYQNVDTDKFIEAMSKSSGVDLKPFEEQWLLNKQVPSLTLSMEGANLLIKQPARGFDFPLDYWIWNDNVWVKKSIEINSIETRIDMGALAGKPVLLDPEVHCMVPPTYKMDYSADTWMALYRNAPNAAEKQRIVQAGFGSLSSSQKVALAKEEKSFRLLNEILDTLGGDQIDFIFSETLSAEPRVVDQAIQVLQRVIEASKVGEMANQASIQTRLTDIWKKSANDRLRSDALQALVALTKDEKLVNEAWNTDSYNDGFRTFAIRWWKQNKPDAARETCLDVMENPPSEAVRVAAIRALGGLKDKGSDDRVFNWLIKVANESSFGAKTAAINALADYGNPAAIKTLNPMTHNSLHFIRRSAQSAITRLGGKAQN